MQWLSDLLPGLNGALNIHPMLVHFPIVLFPLACLLFFLGNGGRPAWMAPAARWALWVGTLTAASAIVSGYLAADGLGHDKPGHDLIHDHRNLMIITGTLALVLSTLVFLLRKKNRPSVRWLLGVGHLVLVVLLVIGSDRGAVLVYRYGFGVQQQNLPASKDHAGDNEHQHN